MWQQSPSVSRKSTLLLETSQESILADLCGSIEQNRILKSYVSFRNYYQRAGLIGLFSAGSRNGKEYRGLRTLGQHPGNRWSNGLPWAPWLGQGHALPIRISYYCVDNNIDRWCRPGVCDNLQVCEFIRLFETNVWHFSHPIQCDPRKCGLHVHHFSPLHGRPDSSSHGANMLAMGIESPESSTLCKPDLLEECSHVSSIPFLNR